MSSLPPSPSADEAIPTLAYARVRDARNGMAVHALVAGLVSLAFPPLGIVALVLGIIALIRSRNLPEPHNRTGTATVAVGLGILSLFVLVMIVPGLLRPACTISPRAICSFNLRCIGDGLKVYSNDNLDWYPTVPFRAPPETGSPDVTSVAFIG